MSKAQAQQWSQQTMVLEGILSMQLGQMHLSMKELRDVLEEMDPDWQNLAKGTYYLMRDHVWQVIDVFGDRKKGTFRTKHWSVREISHAMHVRLEENDPTSTMDVRDPAWATFAADSMEFLGTYFTCLSESTTSTDRWRAVAEFVGVQG